jgi:hypothetical protein
MKTILSLKRRRYLTRIGVFLIAIALIVGLVSCEGGCDGNGNGGVKYSLTMAANPPAGGTANDLTGGSPYAANTSVNIKATANPGYQFSNWAAPAGSFGNSTAATTTFTMPAQNVTVTANFVLTPAGKLDHFTVYNVTSTWHIGQDVALADQFGTFNATVEYAGAFCNPAGKSHAGNVTQMQNADHHFTLYGISIKGDYVVRPVEVDNQFGLQNLTVMGPMALLVPTQKEGHAAPVGLDHYLVYYAYGSPVYVVNVSLSDQWGNQTEFMVWEPIGFAIPAKKEHDGNVTDIVDPETHLVIYDIYGGSINKTVQVANQFGNQTLDVSGPYGLLVPSEKIVPPAPQLDHFKCYNVRNGTPVGDFVDVADQFGYYSFVQVLEADWFCNPVDKNGEGMTNPDNHLTVYNITGVTWGWWNVTVDNQFGWRELTVYGPVALAAPTWKTYPNLHGPPQYLDHYLLYEVVIGLPVGEHVNLDDEFPGVAENVPVNMPRYFANPVLYKYHDGNETGAWDPEAHLVFYDISFNPEWFERVEIYNQFVDYESLNLTHSRLLAVPSEKWYYKQI